MKRATGGACRTSFRAWVIGSACCCAGVAGAATPSDERGFVTDGIAGGLYFQRCEAGGPAATQVLLHDQSPGAMLTAGINEVRRARLDAERPLYVEFRGEMAGKAATVQQFHRAIGHVSSCTALPALPSGVRLHAEGTQPAWRLQATPAGMRLERVGHKPVQFAPMKLTAVTAAGKARSFQATTLPVGARMQVDVTEQPCNDTAAESAFGARVTAQWGEQRLEGCAARF